MRIVKNPDIQMTGSAWGLTILAAFCFWMIIWSTSAFIDVCFWRADIKHDEFLFYKGTPIEVDTSDSVLSRHSSSSVRILLENGDWVMVDYLVLYRNGIERTDSLEGSTWDFYYTQYSGKHYVLNSDIEYHQLVSVTSGGFSEKMEAEVKRDLGTAMCGFFFCMPFVLLGALFFSMPILSELGKCFETKAEQERREKKERRKAERRAKYLEERERLRAEQKKR